MFTERGIKTIALIIAISITFMFHAYTIFGSFSRLNESNIKNTKLMNTIGDLEYTLMSKNLIIKHQDNKLKTIRNETVDVEDETVDVKNEIVDIK
jgi:hypothetical protein